MKVVIAWIAFWCQFLTSLAYAAFPNTEHFNRQQHCAARAFSSSPSYVKVTVESTVSGEIFDSAVTSREPAEAIATEFDLRPKAGEENPPGTVMSEEVGNLFGQFKILKVLMAHPDLRFKLSSREAIESLRPLYGATLLSEIRKYADEMRLKHLSAGRLDNEAVRQLNARYAGFGPEVGRSAIAHVLLERGIHSFVQDLGQTLEVDRAPCAMDGEESLGQAIVEMARLGHDFSSLTVPPPNPRLISWSHEYKREQWCAAQNYSSSPSYVIVHVTDEALGEAFTSVVESTVLHQAVAVEFGLAPVEEHVTDITRLIADHEDLRFEFRKHEAIALLRPRYANRHLLHVRAVLSGKTRQAIIANLAGEQGTQDLVRADDNYWAQIEAAAYVLFELGLYPSRNDMSPTLRVKPSPCELKEESERIAAWVQRKGHLLNDLSSLR